MLNTETVFWIRRSFIYPDTYEVLLDGLPSPRNYKETRCVETDMKGVIIPLDEESRISIRRVVMDKPTRMEWEASGLSLVEFRKTRSAMNRVNSFVIPFKQPEENANENA